MTGDRIHKHSWQTVDAEVRNTTTEGKGPASLRGHEGDLIVDGLLVLTQICKSTNCRAWRVVEFGPEDKVGSE